MEQSMSLAARERRFEPGREFSRNRRGIISLLEDQAAARVKMIESGTCKVISDHLFFRYNALFVSLSPYLQKGSHHP